MVEQDPNIEKKIKYFPGHLDSAFDLSSGGMGIHLHAVADFAARRELAEWEHVSLAHPNSNYLIRPYVFGWRWKEGQAAFFISSRPHATSPHSEAHLRLFDAMDGEYARLKRIQTRLALGGEEALSVPDPEAPITDEAEFTTLLIRANYQGLIKYDPKTSPKIEIAEDDSSLVINLASSGVEISKNWWTHWVAIEFSDRFRLQTLRAAVHKLGCMLGLTEQLAYDARALGVPVLAQYRPTHSIETWEANWQKLFGEQMPDIAGLYRHAHTIFVANALQEDPLVAHLFEIKELPHLK